MELKIPKFDKDKFLQGFKKFLPFLFIEIVIMAGILIMDLVLKDYLAQIIADRAGEDITLINNFLTITYVENHASGLGMGQGIGPVGLSVIMGIAVTIVLLYLNLSHKQSEWLRIPLIFMASGGIGNLVDRVNLGYVRDFFKFEFDFFPYVFNVADIFVTVGAIWLIIYLIVELVNEGKKSKKQFEEDQKKLKENPVVEEKKDDSITITPMGLGDDFLDKDFQQMNAISNDIKAVEDAVKEQEEQQKDSNNEAK